MKNLKTKTNTQVSARNLFTSCLCGLSSAVLASSFALLAPSASALVPLDSDGDGYYEGVDNLEVAGMYYDVEFIYGTFDEVYKSDGGEYDFTFSSSAEVDQAFLSLGAALGGNRVQVEGSNAVSLAYRFEINRWLYIGYDGAEFARWSGSSWLARRFDSVVIGKSRDTRRTIAKFSFSGGGERVSTPEPNLMLGFITLGGLMLGSKRKTKS